MNEKNFLERLRSRARGELSEPERIALERELASAPELRGLAEDFALVHALTEDGRALPSSRTRLEDLERVLDLERAPALSRRAAAAAALVLISAAAFVAGRLSVGAGEAPLYLTSIELDEPFPLPLLSPDVPLQWASYDPRGDQGVRFLSDLGEAEQLARALQRPLLVYGSYPGCPMCVALDQEVFSDPNVMDLAERTVPVRVNLADLSPAEQLSYTARGYPFLEMWRGDGRTTHSLVRSPDPVAFVESLHNGLEISDAIGEQPAWQDLRESAASFGLARAAELEGRLFEAEQGFRALANRPATPEPIALRAAAGLTRLSETARTLLLEARATAGTDVEAARRLLEHASERFLGTSYGFDLDAALERLSHDGRFPPLAEADHSA